MSKVAIITGASRGIGRETAKRFWNTVNEYSTLVLLARKSEDFEEVIKFMGNNNPYRKNFFYNFVDIGNREILQSTIKTIYKDVGNVDLLVNCAGYTNPIPLQQIEFEDFERTMAVNLYGPFTIIQELLHLGNRFEVIINISSTAGIVGRSGWLTYSAAKAALINMSQVLQEELSIYGTRVVSLSPGRTATALRKILAPEEDLSTIMQPENVAEVIEMLSSPIGQFIDSENLVVRKKT